MAIDQVCSLANANKTEREVSLAISPHSEEQPGKSHRWGKVALSPCKN